MHLQGRDEGAGELFHLHPGRYMRAAVSAWPHYVSDWTVPILVHCRTPRRLTLATSLRAVLLLNSMTQR
jgi:hypothetical protein